MWHASVSGKGWRATPLEAFRVAEAALVGVGDAALGEWREGAAIAASGAVHLKRRLSDAERRLHPHVRDVVDIRGTWESTKRRRALAPYLSVDWESLEQ